MGNDSKNHPLIGGLQWNYIPGHTQNLSIKFTNITNMPTFVCAISHMIIAFYCENHYILDSSLINLLCLHRP